MHARYCGGNKRREKWKSRGGVLRNADRCGVARAKIGGSLRVGYLATVALYSRGAISSVCQTRARYFIIFCVLRGESVLSRSLR